jgi:hypothetical protein
MPVFLGRIAGVGNELPVEMDQVSSHSFISFRAVFRNGSNNSCALRIGILLGALRLFGLRPAENLDDRQNAPNG